MGAKYGEKEKQEIIQMMKNSGLQWGENEVQEVMRILREKQRELKEKEKEEEKEGIMVSRYFHGKEPPSLALKSIDKPYMLGFFSDRRHLQLGFFSDRGGRDIDPQFVYTSQLGMDLVEGRWGNLDKSLRFLGSSDSFIDINGSSNGFLLCRKRTRNISGNFEQNYIVCNPVTREFRHLPRPNKSHYLIAVAFICYGPATSSLDKVQFHVIRGGMGSWSDTNRTTTTLEVESYSSTTGQWTSKVFDTGLQFGFSYPKLTACVIGEMVYWPVFTMDDNRRHVILAYDHIARRVQFMDYPKDNERRGCGGRPCSGCGGGLGTSQGKLQYARFDHHKIELWVLEGHTNSGGEWVLRTETGIQVLQPYPSYSSNCLSIIGFHPQHPELVLLAWDSSHAYWCDLERKKLTQVGGGFVDWGLFERRHYFPYEWPLPPSGHDHLLSLPHPSFGSELSPQPPFLPFISARPIHLLTR